MVKIGRVLPAVGRRIDAHALKTDFNGSSALRKRRPGSKPHASLIAVIRSQLMAAGMSADAIEDVPGCTCCAPERFFSFRRDGAASGRHLAAIVAG